MHLQMPIWIMIEKLQWKLYIFNITALIGFIRSILVKRFAFLEKSGQFFPKLISNVDIVMSFVAVEIQMTEIPLSHYSIGLLILVLQVKRTDFVKQYSNIVPKWPVFKLVRRTRAKHCDNSLPHVSILIVFNHGYLKFD